MKNFTSSGGISILPGSTDPEGPAPAEPPAPSRSGQPFSHSSSLIAVSAFSTPRPRITTAPSGSLMLCCTLITAPVLRHRALIVRPPLPMMQRICGALSCSTFCPICGSSPRVVAALRRMLGHSRATWPKEPQWKHWQSLGPCCTGGAGNLPGSGKSKGQGGSSASHLLLRGLTLAPSSMCPSDPAAPSAWHPAPAGDTAPVDRLGEIAESARRLGERAGSWRRRGEIAESVRRLGEMAGSVRRLGDIAESAYRLGEIAESVRRLGDMAESLGRWGEIAESMRLRGDTAGSLRRRCGIPEPGGRLGERGDSCGPRGDSVQPAAPPGECAGLLQRRGDSTLSAWCAAEAAASSWARDLGRQDTWFRVPSLQLQLLRWRLRLRRLLSSQGRCCRLPSKW
mmetsp:Transcript_48822/g.139715  ORF Transcript_48822/g.139715 Transcript_48822/m.139715 type:complete len:397 (+) Transcript_48822:834-2024(+)